MEELSDIDEICNVRAQIEALTLAQKISKVEYSDEKKEEDRLVWEVHRGDGSEEGVAKHRRGGSEEGVAKQRGWK